MILNFLERFSMYIIIVVFVIRKNYHYNVSSKKGLVLSFPLFFLYLFTPLIYKEDVKKEQENGEETIFIYSATRIFNKTKSWN